MATERAMVPYRPDTDERVVLEALAKRLGLSMSRTIGFALRRLADQEGVAVGVQPAPVGTAVGAGEGR